MKSLSSKSPVPLTPPNQGKKSTLSEIQLLEKNREERRKQMEASKRNRADEEQRNRDNGTPGDVDFQRMIRSYRETAPPEQVHFQSMEKICICVRKRPISAKEVKKIDHDSVSCHHPLVAVHDCKLKVDGITKYLDNTLFHMDHTFHEDNSTADIYVSAVEPLIDFVMDGGRATVFAYGQTGSGKTYTMQGIQEYIVEDLFRAIESRAADQIIQVYVSFFEIYGGHCLDLLNEQQRLHVREDGHGEVVVSDIHEVAASSAEELLAVIRQGNSLRTTHATESNDTSSRSHAICQLALRSEPPAQTKSTSSSSSSSPYRAHLSSSISSSTSRRTGVEIGRLSLVDLAGSERGADTTSHDRQRRAEGAEINKSLLALKECVRALGSGGAHVPYRASKLTLVLKDSFTRARSRLVMIATVSPAASSADHTLNTLRYADRLKVHSGTSLSPQPVPSTPSRPVVTPTSATSDILASDATPASDASSSPDYSVSSNNSPSRLTPIPISSSPPRLGAATRLVAPSPYSSRKDEPAGGSSYAPARLAPRHLMRSPHSPLPTGASSTPARGGLSASSSVADKTLLGGARRPPVGLDRPKPWQMASTSTPQPVLTPVRDDGEAAVFTPDERTPPPSVSQSYSLSSPFPSAPSPESIDSPPSVCSADDGVGREVSDLFAAEEELLNLHMASLQENAELLTREGRLLKAAQAGEFSGAEEYVNQLEAILNRKVELVVGLQAKLTEFRRIMQVEDSY